MGTVTVGLVGIMPPAKINWSGPWTVAAIGPCTATGAMGWTFSGVLHSPLLNVAYRALTASMNLYWHLWIQLHFSSLGNSSKCQIYGIIFLVFSKHWDHFVFNNFSWLSLLCFTDGTYSLIIGLSTYRLDINWSGIRCGCLCFWTFNWFSDSLFNWCIIFLILCHLLLISFVQYVSAGSLKTFYSVNSRTCLDSTVVLCRFIHCFIPTYY